METIDKAMSMMMEEFKKEYGESETLQDGDEITGVFNDGIVIISLNDGNLKVQVSAGEPYRFDYNLDLPEQ